MEIICKVGLVLRCDFEPHVLFEKVVNRSGEHDPRLQVGMSHVRISAYVSFHQGLQWFQRYHGDSHE
jgi:hypothetical protein